MGNEIQKYVPGELPTLSELHHDINEAFKHDKFLLLVNQPPHEKWLKKHPMYGNKYLPIDKIEFLLKRIFQRYRIEVLKTGPLFNSIEVTVRVHYIHPLTGEWDFHDGVGAQPLQLDSGANPSDLTKIKPGAVQIALPIAKSMAIKDAADHLGKLFGGDLNRKDTLQFSGSYSENVPPAQETETKTDNPPPPEDDIVL